MNKANYIVVRALTRAYKNYEIRKRYTSRILINPYTNTSACLEVFFAKGSKHKKTLNKRNRNMVNLLL